MKRQGIKILASVALAIALSFAAEVILDNACQGGAAEAATRKVAKASGRKAPKKTAKKSSRKAAAATRAVKASLVTLTASADLKKVARKGTVEFFEKYGCWKLVLGQEIVVTENVTIIRTKDGRKLDNGTVVAKGTAIKVFFKNTAEKAKTETVARKATEKTATKARKAEVVEKKPTVVPAIIDNSRYLLTFAALADYDGQTVDGREIRGERDLCLVGSEFLRDPRLSSRFMFRAERAFTVTANMLVMAYRANGEVRDMNPGQKVAKGEAVVLMFRHDDGISRFAQPEVVCAQETPAATPVATVAVESTPAPVAKPVPETPSYAGILESVAEKGQGVVKTPAFVSMKLAEETFSVNPDFTVRIRTKDGQWRDVEPDATGLVTIHKGMRNVYVFKNVHQPTPAVASLH